MKLNSKYFDNIRSIKDEKKSARQCDNLGCNGSGDYIAKSKNGKINFYCIEHIKLHNKNYNFFSDMTEEEIIDFCRGKIATYRVPRYVRFVDDWPMSGTKIKKVILREMIADELKSKGITQAEKISSS